MTHVLKLILVVCAWLAAMPHVMGAEPPFGRWSGVAKTASESTEVAIELRENGASLSLPRVGVLDWPARSSVVDGDRVVLEFQSDSGVQRMTLTHGEGKLQGAWFDPKFGDDASLSMSRASSASASQEQRVLIEGPAGKLGASLLMPEGKGPFPAVVFLHGSGPQPRDASRFHARELARRGIAALIFDKRGVGQSAGAQSLPAFADLAADAVAVARWLRAQPSISRVGFFGHSQGGWIGPLAASRWSEAAFVIASSGPLVSPARESQWGFVRSMRQSGATEAAVERARGVITQWYDAMKSNQWVNFDREMKAIREESWFSASGLDYFAEHPDAARSAEILLNHDYDPLPALRTMKAPSLWILSRDDESIDAMETASLLEKQKSDGRDIRIKLYQGFDHSLRRLGQGGSNLRWPELPDDLFDVQVEFIKRGVAQRSARIGPRCYTKRVHLNEGGAPVSTGAFDFGKEQAERVYRLVNSVEK